MPLTYILSTILKNRRRGDFLLELICMDKTAKYINSLAYCGLICALCFKREKCAGCKNAANNCQCDCSVKDCYQKRCCLAKKINGCWECPDLDKCEKGVYSTGDFSKIKAFAICIKEDGEEKFIEYVLRNTKKGLSVEKGKDYDNKSIKEVLMILRGEENSNFKI